MATSTSAPSVSSPTRHTTPPAAWIGGLCSHPAAPLPAVQLAPRARRSPRARLRAADVLALEQPARREVDVAPSGAPRRRTARSSPRRRPRPGALPGRPGRRPRGARSALPAAALRAPSAGRDRLGGVARLLGALAHLVEVLVGARRRPSARPARASLSPRAPRQRRQHVARRAGRPRPSAEAPRPPRRAGRAGSRSARCAAPRAGARAPPRGAPRAPRTARRDGARGPPPRARRRSSITSRSRTSPSAAPSQFSSARSARGPLRVDEVAERAQVAAQAARADAHLVQRLDLAEPGARVVQHDPLHAPRDRRAHRDGGRIARAHARRARPRRVARSRALPSARTSFGICSAGSTPSRATIAGDPLERVAVDAAALDLDLAEALRHAAALEHRDAVVDELRELGPVRAAAAASAAGACAGGRPA